MVTNWNDVQDIWEHTFKEEIRVETNEHPVLLTEAPLNPRNNREKMISIVFEKFFVPAIYVANHAVLSLTCSGRTTGIVLESGYGVTHCVPAYEGSSLPHSTMRMNLGGKDISEYLVKLLNDRGHEMKTFGDREVVKNIKENLCFISSDFKSDFSKSENFEKEYELPNGDKLKVGGDRFQAPEILFKPHLIGSEMWGIHENTQQYSEM